MYNNRFEEFFFVLGQFSVFNMDLIDLVQFDKVQIRYTIVGEFVICTLNEIFLMKK